LNSSANLDTFVNVADFDIILVNTSAGKDSQTMMRVVVGAATEAGVLDRVVAVHADLGRVEWEGTADLAEEQAGHYGLRFIKVARPQGDLLTHIEAHGKFPSSAARFCTSDHKRGQVRKVITALVKEQGLSRPVRVLNCMGLRAQESPARAKKEAFRYDAAASGKGTVRQVFEWLPILDWSLDEVWKDIAASGVRYHEAYDFGMPRLSCCFCVLSTKSALVLAAQHNPRLADEYAAVEVRIGHHFTHKLSMAMIIEEAQSATVTAVDDWAA
jgi:3'-phosphoadenosine 5'-phosphosulfate sulfotransferase (PAPS reductase)/FAD synthetase